MFGRARIIAKGKWKPPAGGLIPALAGGSLLKVDQREIS